MSERQKVILEDAPSTSGTQSQYAEQVVVHCGDDLSNSARIEIQEEEEEITEAEEWAFGEMEEITIDEDGRVTHVGTLVEGRKEWSEEKESDAKSSLIPAQRKRGRQQSEAVIKVVDRRQLPPRAARVQSFKDLENSFEGPAHLRALEESQDGVVSHSRPIPLKGERSRNLASRVFVQSDFSGMHFDWPVFTYESLPWSKIAHICLTDASQVDSDRICDSVPQEFTGTGTFLVDLKFLAIRHELVDDSLGEWGKPSASIKYFTLDHAGKIVNGSLENYHLKINCNRYIHPGTDERGRFIKKIYTGTTRAGENASHSLICYEWEGDPHPIAVEKRKKRERIVFRPQGQRSWEVRAALVDLQDDEGLSWKGHPLFSRYAIDFEAVCQVLLAEEEILPHRICVCTPENYRQTGTFVVDLSKPGGELALIKDGFRWAKPSGTSRHFRYDSSGVPVRVDLKTSPEFDVKILCKRYDCEEDSLQGFVRKIYTCKEGMPTGRVNTGLAVLVYLWKLDPFEPNALPHKQEFEVLPNVPKRTKLDEEPRRTYPNPHDYRERDIDPSVLDAYPLPHADHLQRMALQKELQNQHRLTGLLDRAEAFFDRFESAGAALGLFPQGARTPQFVVHEGGDVHEHEDIGDTGVGVWTSDGTGQVVEERNGEDATGVGQIGEGARIGAREGLGGGDQDPGSHMHHDGSSSYVIHYQEDL